MVISRRTFALAIAAGMERAGEMLSPEDVGRLQHVAAHATRFHANFAFGERVGELNHGCPASQASLFLLSHSHSHGRSPAEEFAYGFDDYMATVDPWWWKNEFVSVAPERLWTENPEELRAHSS
jgi:hypothetical protein